MYLVDSDWFIDYLEDIPAAVALLEPLVSAGVRFSIITYVEAFEGTLKSDDPVTAQDKLHAGMRQFEVIRVSDEVARRCAWIRYDLRSRARRIRDRAMVLLIAATAIEYDLTLVTRNVDDYGDIPGLRLY